MFQDLLKLMQEGGGFGLYPLPMFHDPDYKPKPFIIQCRGKSTFVVNECHVCAQWFLNNDILVASCGHMYHVFCMAYYAGFHPCCKITNCKEEFQHDWLAIVDIWPLNDVTLTSLRVESPMRFAWLQRLKHEAYNLDKILLLKLWNVFVFHVSVLNLTKLDLLH
jgi:hypothetical protein